MDKETFDKWIAALESGNYRKGKSLLKYSTEGSWNYCCLGVLGDMLDMLEDSLSLPSHTLQCWVKDTQDNYFLPESLIRRWEQISLARINDASDSFEPVIEALKTMENVIVK